MSGNKYLTTDSGGNYVEVAATQASAGVGSAGQIPALNAQGLIDNSMLPAVQTQTNPLTTVSLTASQTLPTGCLVSIFTNGGAANVCAADAATDKLAHGFSLSSASAGAQIQVAIGNGLNPNLSSLTPGSTYYLGNGGAYVLTPSTQTGALLQFVGVALSATAIYTQLGTATKQ